MRHREHERYTAERARHHTPAEPGQSYRVRSNSAGKGELSGKSQQPNFVSNARIGRTFSASGSRMYGSQQAPWITAHGLEIPRCAPERSNTHSLPLLINRHACAFTYPHGRSRERVDVGDRDRRIDIDSVHTTVWVPAVKKQFDSATAAGYIGATMPTNLPSYIDKAVPNPAANRGPWYKNTAPSYAGIFLWVVFYQTLANGTLTHATPWFCVGALVVAGILSYALYYYAPAMLGMKTGYPLYVVGSSTFGTAGGYLMPGLLMGLLQVGWFAVATFFATSYILQGLGKTPRPGTLLFAVVAIIWGYVTGTIGAKGVQYVAKVSLILTIIPALMVLYVFAKTAGGISSFQVPDPNPTLAFTTLLQAVIGFFATAGAAGADFGMNARSASDVKLGGIFGVTLATVYAGALPLLSVAGANGSHPGTGWGYDAVITSIGGVGASAMFFLFAIASVVASCFCSFIAGNSFATMIPGVPRIGSSMVGVTVGIILAVTGAAANLTTVFSLVGASFGPICGAMLADYLLSGGKWAGPREGINWAGYLAWAVGFVIGIIPISFVPASPSLKALDQPAVLYSMIAGFIVYAVVAKLGGEPKPVAMPQPQAAD